MCLGGEYVCDRRTGKTPERYAGDAKRDTMAAVTTATECSSRIVGGNQEGSAEAGGGKDSGF